LKPSSTWEDISLSDAKSAIMQALYQPTREAERPPELGAKSRPASHECHTIGDLRLQVLDYCVGMLANTPGQRSAWISVSVTTTPTTLLGLDTFRITDEDRDSAL
jgi:hypothetical protein